METVALFYLSSLSLGFLLMQAIPTLSTKDRVSRIMMSFGLGSSVWMIFLLGLGLTTGFSRPVLDIIAGCLIIAFLSLREKMKVTTDLIHLKPSHKILIFITSLFLILPLVASFLHPFGGIRNDEVATHLLLPKHWSIAGRIVPIPLFSAYLAGNVHLLYTWAWMGGGYLASRFVNWAFLLGILCVTWMIAKGATRSIKISIMACLSIVTMPLLFRLATVSFIDLGVTFFLILSLSTMLLWSKHNRSAHLLIAALFAGIACSIKPSAWFYLPAFLAVFTDVCITRKEFPKFPVMILMAILFLVPASLWPIRNIFLTGLPSIPPPPLWIEIFGRPHESFAEYSYTQEIIHKQAEYYASRMDPSMTGSIANYFMLPWNHVMHHERFNAGDSIGCLSLALLPFALIGAFRFSTIRRLVIFFVFTTAALYFGIIPETRYMLSAIIAILIAGVISSQVLLKKKWQHLSFAFVLSVSLLFSFLVDLRICVPEIRSLFDKKFAAENIDIATPFAEALSWCNSVGAQRSLYVPQEDQIWFYLHHSYKMIRHQDGSVVDPPTGSFIIDIDQSQRLDRNLYPMTGDWFIKNPPANWTLVLQTVDARIYKVGTVSR